MLSKGLKLATAVVVLSAGSVAAVPAAQADTVQCSRNVKTFDLPYKPDVTVTVNLCIKRSSSNGRISAYASMKWAGGSDLGGTRFNDFKLTLRLERRDVIKKNTSYNLVYPLNHTRSGTRNFVPGVYLDRTARGGWSADGVLTYDINQDGHGDYPWHLEGSPLIG